MEKIEFRVSPDGHVYFTPQGEKERRLSRFEKGVCVKIMDIIIERFPGAWARLRTIYPVTKKTNAEIDKAYYKAIERFIRCNFGEHDTLTADIEHDILNFEEVRCPLRGICPHENVICKPRSMIRLSEAEREVVKYYLTPSRRLPTCSTSHRTPSRASSTASRRRPVRRTAARLSRLSGSTGSCNDRVVNRIKHIM